MISRRFKNGAQSDVAQHRISLAFELHCAVRLPDPTPFSCRATNLRHPTASHRIYAVPFSPARSSSKISLCAMLAGGACVVFKVFQASSRILFLASFNIYTGSNMRAHTDTHTGCTSHVRAFLPVVRSPCPGLPVRILALLTNNLSSAQTLWFCFRLACIRRMCSRR